MLGNRQAKTKSSLNRYSMDVPKCQSFQKNKMVASDP